MENQHREIRDYRELNQDEIDAMNKVKGLGVTLGQAVDAMRQIHGLDQRWVSIGATHLQEGLMALTRSIRQADVLLTNVAIAEQIFEIMDKYLSSGELPE
jgi:hypothetical protein